MKSKFKDPIESTVKPVQKKSPWDFTCPEYDERTSCYVNAGSHYGIGFKQPVGHKGDPKSKVDVLPRSPHPTMEVAEIPRKNLSIEMEK